MMRMKSEYDIMQHNYYQGFPITDEEKEKITKFKNEHRSPEDRKLGAHYTYTFIPTALGTIGVIKDDLSGDELEFKELS